MKKSVLPLNYIENIKYSIIDRNFVMKYSIYTLNRENYVFLVLIPHKSGSENKLIKSGILLIYLPQKQACIHDF